MNGIKFSDGEIKADSARWTLPLYLPRVQGPPASFSAMGLLLAQSEVLLPQKKELPERQQRFNLFAIRSQAFNQVGLAHV